MTKRKQYDCRMADGAQPIRVWNDGVPGFTVEYGGRSLTYYLSECPELLDLHKIAKLVHRRLLEHAAANLAHREEESA